MKAVRKKVLGRFLTAVTLAMGAAAAQAGPIPTVKIDPSPGGDLFPFGSDIVKVIFNDQGSNSVSVTVRAGTYKAEATNGTGGFDPADLYRDEDNVLLYCVDLLDNLLTGNQMYNVYDVAPGEVLGGSDQFENPRRDFGRMFDFLGAVNAQMTTLGFGFGKQNWLEPGTGWLAGAIQVGIWESLYEASNVGLLNITSGNFKVYGVDSQGSSTSARLSYEGGQFLTDVFGAMSNVQDLSADLVKRFVPVDANGIEIRGQELIGDPVDVPSPASLLLMLGGLGLLGLRARSA